MTVAPPTDDLSIYRFTPNGIIETSTEGVTDEDEPKCEQDEPAAEESKNNEACGNREVLQY